MSSVAAWRGVPGSGVYSASKAALSTYMDAVSTEVLGKGIRTTVIYPGFIDTDINKSIKQRPFLLSAEEGGRRIVEAIERGDSKAVVPAMPWRALFPVLKGLSNPLMRRAFGSGA
jgi:short-subunit dehydrogenase